MKKIALGLIVSIGLLSNIAIAQENTAINKKYSKEIARLAKAKKVEAAFTYIEDLKDQTTKDHIKLTEILAPPFKEDEKGVVFMNMLKEAGVDSIWTDKVGNVIGLRKGTSGTSGYVGIDAHLDVVFPEGTDVSVKKVGDTLKAPGIGDDTRHSPTLYLW